MKKSKIKKSIIRVFLLIFILLNLIAFIHAYKFTHFVDDNSEKTKSPDKLNTIDKVKTLFFGVNNPKPKNVLLPSQKFETIKIKSNKIIECWYIKNDSAKGTVILFHGYGGEKSSMIERSDVFLKLGYNTFLVDFMGSGNSEGVQTTIGYKEAEEVKETFDFLNAKGEQNIYLFGTSMGSVSILKAINDYKIDVKGIIIECPFGSMYKTTCARFNRMNAPTFPMAGLLVFWGGIQNGFWAFGHQPTEYAKNVSCPTLLLYGESDKSVSRLEIDEIFKNLNGKKTLKTYKLTGHENYLIKNKDAWISDVTNFTNEIND